MVSNVPSTKTDPFYTQGDDDDPDSNVVAEGSKNGKLLLADVAHNSLVAKFVYTCIALIAIDKFTGHIGLWHLHKDECERQIVQEILPTLKTLFDSEQTELYLIGGKNNQSYRLADDLLAALPKAGYSIADTALFSKHTLDVAVDRMGEIYVRDHDNRMALMHKSASASVITEFRTMGIMARANIMHMQKPRAVINPALS